MADGSKAPLGPEAHLRGQAGERQVQAEVALCHGHGGTLASQTTAILGTGATL